MNLASPAKVPIVETPARPARVRLVQRSVDDDNDHSSSPGMRCACGGQCPRCQAKADGALSISVPGDHFEREADRAADTVTSTLHGRSAIHVAPTITPFAPTPVAAAMPASAGEATVMRAEDGACAAGGMHDFAARLDAGHSRGEPLAADTRSRMEGGFGADFSAVRVHTDPAANDLARDAGARAFTTGSDIYFRAGEYQPQTSAGDWLLAHELTHVAQQGTGLAGGARPIHRQVDTASEVWDAVTTTASEGTSAVGSAIRSGVADVREAVGAAGSAVAGAARSAGHAVAALVEEHAPGLLAFFSGIRDTIAGQVRAGFDALFGGLAGRIRREGFAAAMGSVLAELAGNATRSIGEFLAGKCAALGSGAELLLQLGLRFGRESMESLREGAAAIGAYFGDLWEAYGAPAADALSSFAGGIWASIVAQVSEWWQQLAPLREAAGEIWDWVVEHVTQGYADLQSYMSELFRHAVESWEALRRQILPFMGHLKAVGLVLVLLSPIGPFVAAGTAAYGLYRLLAYLVENWGRPLTAEIRALLSTHVLPALVAQLQALQAGIAQASAWFGGLAARLATEAAALVQASGVLPYLQVAREFVGQIAAQLQQFATTVGHLVERVAGAVREFIRAALRYLQPIGEYLRQSLLIVTLGPLAIIDDGVWDTVTSLAKLAQRVPCLREAAAFVRLPAILEQGKRFRQAAKAVWALIQHPEPILNALREALAPMVASVPRLASSLIARWFFPNERRHREGIERHLQPAIDNFLAHWWDELKRLGWTLIWPIDEIGQQLSPLVERGSNAIDAVFNLEIGRAIDEFLGMLQSANAILGALWGWFAIASVLVGGALGALGVAFSGGTSIAAGAGAGWALAETVGLVLMAGAVLTETAIIRHSEFDLRFTNETITDADEKLAADDADYKAIAGSAFSMAVMGGLLVLGAVAQKLASAIWRAVAEYVPGRAALGEFLRRPRGASTPESARALGEPTESRQGTAPPEESAILDRTASKNAPDLTPTEFTTELEAAERGPAEPIDEPPFTTRRRVGNGHDISETPDGDLFRRCSPDCALFDHEGRPIEEPDVEEAPPAETASAKEAAREEMRRRLEELRQEKDGVDERYVELNQQIFEQTREVNRLRARVMNEPRGSAARATALEDFTAAKERLEELVDMRLGTVEERLRITERERVAARARPGRSPEDIDIERRYEGRDAPQDSASPATVGDSPTQNSDVARWINRLNELGAIDIRVDQIQVNSDLNVVGANRPDLQFILNNERFYVEWDRPSSARGPQHAIRIQTNDPSAVGVLDIAVDPGYALPPLSAAGPRIILITME